MVKVCDVEDDEQSSPDRREDGVIEGEATGPDLVAWPAAREENGVVVDSKNVLVHVD